MTRIKVKRLKALMYWVQYCHICQDNYDFPDVITQQQFINDVDESLKQYRTRKKALETGKQRITHKFVVPFKNCNKWEIWDQNLQDTLVSIIGTDRFSLSYVIREVDVPNYARNGTWEEKAIATSSLK